MKKGDILQLSAEGLGRLTSGIKRREDRLRGFRFEFIKNSTKYDDCIQVKRLSKKQSYQTYHKSFLEKG